MKITSPGLLGRWEKRSANGPCDQPYPDLIEFREQGLYSGWNRQPGAFTIWDAGTYAAQPDDTIRISTANDAILTYAYRLEDGQLVVIDAGGCELRYARACPDPALKAPPY